MSKISELSDGGSLVSSDYLIAVRSGGNVKVRMDQINVDQVDLGDNEFIRLGNSQDLTMVHTSTQSIINQAGIGDLLLQKAGATKLTINATGIDVTGTVTADGLTVSGTAGTLATLDRTGSNGVYLALTDNSGSNVFLGNSGGQFQVQTAGASYSSKLTVESNGDISFYDDTAAQALFWDSSASALGIGTTTPDAPLDIQLAGTATADIFKFQRSDGAVAGVLNYNGTDGAISLGTTTAHPLAFDTNNVERMRIDSNGVLQSNGYSVVASSARPASGTLRLGNIASTSMLLDYDDQGQTIATVRNQYGTTDATAELSLDSGFITFNTGTSFTERMTIDSSGTTTFTKSGGGNIRIAETASRYAEIFGYAEGTANGSTMTFHTIQSGTSTSTERMRITHAGYTKMSPTGTYVSAAASYHEMYQNYAGIAGYIYNGSATGDGLLLNTNNENTSNFFLAGYSDSAARYNVYIYSNGNLLNRFNSYGGFSDQKLKQDIEDASSQWDDVKAMQFRKYRWKQDVAADADAPYQLGVIAQELEAAGMSGLVEETADKEFYDEVCLDEEGNPVVDEDGNNVTEQKERLTGESTKSVKYSILTMKALVALQEAMTRIESLEARIAALES